MKSANTGRSVPGQVVLGLLVIAIGVLFLLDNLGIIEFRQALSFWPVLLIVLGIVKLSDTRSPNGNLAGFLLVGVGATMMLSRVGLFDFSWRMLWPSVLIVVGGSVVYKALAGRRAHEPHGDQLKADGNGDDFIDATAILGSFERRLTTPNFSGGELTAMMGGCSIDLRGCSMQGEVVVNVFAVMGGINLKVPPDWTVILHGTPIMGGFEEKTVRPPDGSKRLIVRGYAVMGGVEVRN